MDTLHDPRNTDWYQDGWFSTEDGYVIAGDDLTQDEATHRTAMLLHHDTEDSWEESLSTVSTYSASPFRLRRDWQRCNDNDPMEHPDGIQAWHFH